MEAEVRLQSGALVIMGMFILTITMAVSSHHFLHMPPVLGMMAGLGLLNAYGYYLERRDTAFPAQASVTFGESALTLEDVVPAPPAGRSR